MNARVTKTNWDEVAKVAFVHYQRLVLTTSDEAEIRKGAMSACTTIGDAGNHGADSELCTKLIEYVASLRDSAIEHYKNTEKGE